MHTSNPLNVKRVMLTGSSGFLGNRLAEVMIDLSSVELSCMVRRSGACRHGREVLGDILRSGKWWVDALANQDVVIHTAARAHIMRERSDDPLAEYRKVNVDGTLNLARKAAAYGVKRFIYISSIKVNGEQTQLAQPFTADDAPAPVDFYGTSKLEAEVGLHEVASETGMDVVIIRPPLIYGPGVKGNFASMIKLVEKGWPLPLGAINNKRSLVALDNLVDLIIACVDHPAASNQVFLAGDDMDISTTELLRRVGQEMGKPARLIPVPEGMLIFGATLFGKKAVAQRLIGSLQVDISKTINLLGWNPPLSVEEGLRRCFVTEN